MQDLRGLLLGAKEKASEFSQETLSSVVSSGSHAFLPFFFPFLPSLFSYFLSFFFFFLPFLPQAFAISFWVDKEPFSTSAFLKNGGHRARPGFTLICRSNTWSFIHSLFEKYFLSSWHKQNTVLYAVRNTTNKTSKKLTNCDTLCLSSRGP